MWGYKHFASSEARSIATIGETLVLHMFRVLTICVLIFDAAIGVARPAKFNVSSFDRARVLKAANQYLSETPITITASTSPRSAGGPHDFFPKAITGGRIRRILKGLTFSATE